jgi:hypothetical protein
MPLKANAATNEKCSDGVCHGFSAVYLRNSDVAPTVLDKLEHTLSRKGQVKVSSRWIFSPAHVVDYLFDRQPKILREDEDASGQ